MERSLNILLSKQKEESEKYVDKLSFLWKKVEKENMFFIALHMNEIVWKDKQEIN